MTGAAAETNRAWPMASLVVLVALGGINVFLALFIVPKFEQIFADVLPGKLLPGLTVFIIEGRFLLALLAVGWPVAGIVAVWKQWRAWKWMIILGHFFLFALVGVTVIALFMPMIGAPVFGLSDQPLTSAEGSR